MTTLLLLRGSLRACVTIFLLFTLTVQASKYPLDAVGTWNCTLCPSSRNLFCPNLYFPDFCALFGNNGVIKYDPFYEKCHCECLNDDMTGPFCTTRKSSINGFQPTILGERTYKCHKYMTSSGYSRLNWDMCSTSSLGNRFVYNASTQICSCDCDDYAWGRYCQHHSDTRDFTVSNRDAHYCMEPKGRWVPINHNVTTNARGYCYCYSGWTGIMCDQQWSDVSAGIDRYLIQFYMSYDCTPSHDNQYIPNMCHPTYGRITHFQRRDNVSQCLCDCSEGYTGAGVHCSIFDGMSSMLDQPCNTLGHILHNQETCFCGNHTLNDYPGVIWTGKTCSNPTKCNMNGTLFASCDQSVDGFDIYRFHHWNCLAYTCHCKNDIDYNSPFCNPLAE